MYSVLQHISESVSALRKAVCCVVVALIMLNSVAIADDWTFFRGPNHNGVSTETGWMQSWGEAGPKVAWRADIGIGASSVVVAGDTLVTMGAERETDEESVWCLDANTGATRWTFRYPAEFDARQFEGGPASTPTIDGECVYTLGYLGHLHCLTLAEGKVVWKKHLVEDFEGRHSAWKYAGSPLVVGELLIVDTGAEGASTIALDKNTGHKVWGAGDDLAGYASPIPFAHADGQGVLVFKARAMVAHDLADGRELWRIEWRTNYDCNASCPTVIGDKVFISTGYGGHRARGALFQLGDGEPRELWLNQDLETRMSSAVVFEGCVYCISERGNGQLMCIDLTDGSVLWAEPSFAKYGTLMIADGKLIILDEKGDLVIADAKRDEY